MSIPIQEYAQAFADKWNVRVFPLQVTTDGKKVMVSEKGGDNTWKRATTDTNRWSESQWRRATGYGAIPDGYTVVDLDSTEGVANLREATGGDVPDTLVVKTPRGVHIWLRGETRQVDALAKHVDIRSGDGGYVVGPGSYNPHSDREWKVVDESKTIADVNSRLRKFIMGGSTQDESLRVRDSGSSGSLQDLADEHGRNNTLAQLKGALMRYGVGEDFANHLVTAANAALADPLSDNELEHTILIAKDHWEVGHIIEDDLVAFARMDAMFMSAAELAARPMPTYIIDRIFPEGTVNVMYGPPGSYKSFVALDWAHAIATGTPLNREIGQGAAAYDVPNRRKVLYVAAEGVGGMSKRVKAANMEESPVMFYGDSINVLNSEVLNRFTEKLNEHDIQLVIWDTLRKISPGADENKVQDMGRLMTALESLSTVHNITSLVVHHANRNREGGVQYRGSSAIEADAYNMWSVEGNADELTATISATKFKDAEPAELVAQLGVHPVYNSLRVLSYAGDLNSEETAELSDRQRAQMLDRQRDNIRAWVASEQSNGSSLRTIADSWDTLIDEANLPQEWKAMPHSQPTLSRLLDES